MHGCCAFPTTNDKRGAARNQSPRRRPSRGVICSMPGQHLAQGASDLIEMAVIDDEGRRENDAIADDAGQDARLEEVQHHLLAALAGFLGRERTYAARRYLTP